MGDAVRILIVDDDSSTRDLLRRQLEMAGFVAAAAASAEDALEILASNEISVVLTDIHLAGMSGLELTERIRRECTADVIVMTGYIEKYSYEQIVGQGASDFVTKPIRAQELVARLKRVIAQRQMRQMRDKLLRDFQDLAVTDGLTGLFNSRHFHNQLELEIGRAKRYARKLSLLFMDIDFFKRYNDTYGHLEGDRALALIGAAVKSCLRAADTAYRYGGEEFAVILVEAGCKEALIVSNRILETVAALNLNSQPGPPVHLTLSVGATEYVADEDAAPFIRRADFAMYAAKKAGRNRVQTECIAGGVAVEDESGLSRGGGEM